MAFSQKIMNPISSLVNSDHVSAAQCDLSVVIYEEEYK